MNIRIRPYADLGRFFSAEPGQTCVVSIEAGATVGDLLEAHGIEASVRVTLGVNNQLATRETQLKDGDNLEVLAPMSGGSRNRI